MLNAEKFKEEIEKLDYEIAVVNGNITPCKSSQCGLCMFNKGYCQKETLRWLLSEYEEPKIESEVYNLKMDDKIEVSDDGEKWRKRYLSRIVDNKVYAWWSGATSWSGSSDAVWEYARIPREE